MLSWSAPEKLFINGEFKDFSEEDKNYWHKKKHNDLADEGLRVLAFAYKTMDKLPEGKAAEDFFRDFGFYWLDWIH